MPEKHIEPDILCSSFAHKYIKHILFKKGGGGGGETGACYNMNAIDKLYYYQL